jgi:hypothetical protein
MDEVSAHNKLVSYRLSPPTGAVKIYGGAGQSVTIANGGPGLVRSGSPSNAGAVGAWSDLAVGSNVQVAAGTARVFELVADSVQDAVLSFAYP